MNPFEYAAPDSLPEAIALLSSSWGETEILAGGSDLITCLKQGVTAPKRLVSLRNIKSLRGIDADRRVIKIGATTTLAEIAKHDDVAKHFPSIVQAIKGIGSPQIVNVGTIAGDLCQRPRCWYFRNGYGLFGLQGETSLVRNGDNRYHAIFGTDGPDLFVSPSSLGPALVALGATIVATGPQAKKRDIPAAEFFRAPKSDQQRETALNPNEIVTEIQIPIKGLKNATYEVRHRHGFDWPYATATVAYQLKDGAASNAQVVLGHVAPVPWQAQAAAQALNGNKVDATAAAKCGDAAVANAKPLSKNAYKTQLVKTAVKRAILAAAEAA